MASLLESESFRDTDVEGREPKKQNIVFDALDNINRLQYGVANSIYEALVEGNTNIAQSFWDGLTLKDKRSIGDTIQEFVQPESKIGKAAVFAAGLAGDIFTDPLTYLGVGLLSKGGKATKFGKSLTRLKALDKTNLIRKGTQAEAILKAYRTTGEVSKVTQKTLTFGAKIPFTQKGFEVPIKGTEKAVDFIARNLAKTGFKLREEAPVISQGLDFASKMFKIRPKGMNPVRWEKLKTLKQKHLNIARKATLDADEKISELTGLFRKEQEDALKFARETGLSPDEEIKFIREYESSVIEGLEKGVPFSPAGKEIRKHLDDISQKYKRTFGTDLDEQDYRYISHLMVKNKNFKILPAEFKTGNSLSRNLVKYKGLLPEDAAKVRGLERTIKNTQKSLHRINAEISLQGNNVALRKSLADSTAKHKVLDSEVKALQTAIKDIPDKTMKSAIKERDKAYQKMYRDRKKIAAIEKDIKAASPDEAIKLRKEKDKLSKQMEVMRSNMEQVKIKEGDYIVNLDNGNIFAGSYDNPAGKLDSSQLSRLKEGTLDYGKTYQATIREINRGLGVKLFSTDLTKVLIDSTEKAQKVITADSLFKKMARFGLKHDTGGLQTLGSVQEAVPEIAGKYFEPSVAKHIDSYFNSMKPKEIETTVERIGKNMQAIQNVWKATATLINPAFHSRNFLSNIYQNYLSGIDNPVLYSRAAKIQKGIKAKTLSSADSKLVREFKEQGLQFVGWTSGDIEKGTVKSINEMFDKIKAGSLIKAGGRVGEAIETNAKLAHFIAKREAGLSAYEAGLSVKRALFDYQDISEVDKAIRNVVPFWTFTRKNIPYQLNRLIETPGRATTILKLKNNVEVLAGDDKTAAILPDWLKDASPIFIGKKDKKVRYAKMEGFFPTADLAKLSDPAKEMVNMLSPVLKVPLEQALNKNFFFGRDITGEKGIKGFVGGAGERDFLFWRIPGRLEHLARLFRPITEVEKLFGDKYTGLPWQDKVLSYVLGFRVYEKDVKDLMDRHERELKSDASNAMRQINILRKQYKVDPRLRNKNREDIKTLKVLLRKRRKQARADIKKARQSIR